MWKECNVVLLVTNEKANVYLNEYADNKNKANKLVFTGNIIGELNSSIKDLEDRGYKAQHLYITSNEVPNKYENCLNNINEELHICLDVEECKDCKKIISTTNKLYIRDICNCSEEEAILCGKPKAEGLCQQYIPKLPLSFINYYVTEYNKGNIITKVIVEYNDEPTTDGDWKKYSSLKVNSDNTINIKPINTDFLDINYANIDYISRRYT